MLALLLRAEPRICRALLFEWFEWELAEGSVPKVWTEAQAGNAGFIDLEIRDEASDSIAWVEVKRNERGESGENQLRKYQEELEADAAWERRGLVYLTRPDRPPAEDVELDSSASYLHTTWANLATWLNENFESNAYVHDFLIFMREDHLDMKPLTSEHLEALEASEQARVALADVLAEAERQLKDWLSSDEASAIRQLLQSTQPKTSPGGVRRWANEWHLTRAYASYELREAFQPPEGRLLLEWNLRRRQEDPPNFEGVTAFGAGLTWWSALPQPFEASDQPETVSAFESNPGDGFRLFVDDQWRLFHLWHVEDVIEVNGNSSVEGQAREIVARVQHSWAAISRLIRSPPAAAGS